MKKFCKTNGPRQFMPKSAMKKPGKKQSVTVYAVVPSTWKSKYKPQCAKVVKTIASMSVAHRGDEALQGRDHNPGLISKPGQIVMVLFHGHGGGGTIAKIGDKWWKVIAMRGLFKSVIPDRDPAMEGWPIESEREPTGEYKAVLVRIKTPEAAAEFLELVTA